MLLFFFNRYNRVFHCSVVRLPPVLTDGKWAIPFSGFNPSQGMSAENAGMHPAFPRATGNLFGMQTVILSESRCKSPRSQIGAQLELNWKFRSVAEILIECSDHRETILKIFFTRGGHYCPERYVRINMRLNCAFNINFGTYINFQNIT